MKSSLLFYLQLLQKQNKASEAGLTLIESIAAIVISTLILTAMAPPLLFSAATRVQARKVEQAQSLARLEVERVRAGLAREQGIGASNEAGNIPPESDTTPLVDTPAPTQIVSDRASLGTENEERAFTVDADGDGDDDFFIQLLRTQGIRFSAGGSGGQLAAFRMGVRVYDIFARNNLGSLNTNPASLQMTKGVGERTTNPLAVTYVDLYRSDLNLSLQEMRESIICNNDPTNPVCPSP